MLSVIYSISLLVAVCASQSVHAQNKDIFDVERPNNNNNNNFNNDHLYNKNIFANSLENSDFDCYSMCSKRNSLASIFCNCFDYRTNINHMARMIKKQYPIDCQVLCFIGQGGKACNCNYAPFVGKK